MSVFVVSSSLTNGQRPHVSVCGGGGEARGVGGGGERSVGKK